MHAYWKHVQQLGLLTRANRSIGRGGLQGKGCCRTALFGQCYSGHVCKVWCYFKGVTSAQGLPSRNVVLGLLFLGCTGCRVCRSCQASTTQLGFEQKLYRCELPRGRLIRGLPNRVDSLYNGSTSYPIQGTTSSHSILGRERVKERWGREREREREIERE